MADNREHTEALDLAVRYCDFVECALDPRGAAQIIHAQLAEVDRLHRQITQLADDLDAKAASLEAAVLYTTSSSYAAENAIAASQLRADAARVRALGQPAPQPVPENQPEDGAHV